METRNNHNNTMQTVGTIHKAKLLRSVSQEIGNAKQNRTKKKLKELSKLDIIGFQTIIDKLNYQSRSAAGELLVKLFNLHLNIVTVESLTAGKIVSTLIDIPSYAASVYGGFVVYDTDAKREFIGVTTKSVYSQKCAGQMAEGALKNSRAMCSLAVTGHAGGYDDTDDTYLGYVDIGFSIRSGSDTFNTFTRRVKFCEESDLAEACKEYNTRLVIFHKTLPELLKDAPDSVLKNGITDIKQKISPYGTPLSDDLYQIRMIIRTACVAKACLFALHCLNKIDKNYIEKLEGNIFDPQQRDTELKLCQEPSKIIRKYMKDDEKKFTDDEYNWQKVPWPNKFGESGDANDTEYESFCNQEDISPIQRRASRKKTK